MTMTAVAGGLISLLDEKNPRLQSLALTKLIQVVDSCWLEIADAIIRIETLHEQDSFPDRKRAALLASKVHFHLGSYEDAVQYALAADELFDVTVHNEYVDTIVSKCIDQYAHLRQRASLAKEGEKVEPIDARLESVVNRMFARCFQHRQYKQALGIAVESHRCDMFRKTILDSGDQPQLLAYAVQTVLALVENRKYRNELLHVLVELYNKLKQPDFINMCQCLIFLDEPQAVADILLKLIAESKTSTQVAFQIAFDLYESATQQYVGQILSTLTTKAPIPPTLGATAVASGPATSSADKASTSEQPAPEAGKEKSSEKDEKPTPMETEAVDIPVLGTDSEAPKAPAAEAAAPPKVEKQRSKTDLSEAERTTQDRIEKLLRILSGDEAIYLHMQFLIKNNHTDMLLLSKIKDTVRNSVGHSATVVCNGLMHCGTTCDDFLRENLEWVGKATNWAKYCAVASLGVIHKGHEQEAMRLLESYLPKDGNAASTGYMEGGGLFAFGLIHANHGTRVIDYLKGQLEGASMENVRHGAAMGLGLSAMATHRQDLYAMLLQHLNQDDAITGEACGLSMGLVMMGSASPTAIQDMVGYAQLTQHEKIIRGLSIGIALVMYGRREEAEPLIDNLIRDKDPILRRSAVYSVAMAHCGTGNNASIRRLLHIAVSDVNDDVKRAAVMSLGFLLFRTPHQCPTMVSLLSESYNPHVRYGAAMALGISCAGTGLREAIELLEPMLTDSTNYVRQGCMIAMAMILIQQNEVTCPKVKEFREHLMKVILDKVEDTMTKFGAIIAHGILDAGGRNVTISLQSRNGQTDMESVVGVLIFAQYWYWFSLSLCLSMALKPTAVIGLNDELQMPKLQFHCAAKPSTYAYPPPLEEKKEAVAEKVETAVLSITAKSKMREAAKAAEKMDTPLAKADAPQLQRRKGSFYSVTPPQRSRSPQIVTRSRSRSKAAAADGGQQRGKSAIANSVGGDKKRSMGSEAKSEASEASEARTANEASEARKASEAKSEASEAKSEASEAKSEASEAKSEASEASEARTANEASEASDSKEMGQSRASEASKANELMSSVVINAGDLSKKVERLSVDDAGTTTRQAKKLSSGIRKVGSKAAQKEQGNPEARNRITISVEKSLVVKKKSSTSEESEPVVPVHLRLEPRSPSSRSAESSSGGNSPLLSVGKRDTSVGKKSKSVGKKGESVGKSEESERSVGKSEKSVGKESENVGKSEPSVGKKSESVGKSEPSVGKKSESVGKSEPSVGKNNEIAGKSVDGVGKVAEKTWLEREIELSGCRSLTFIQPINKGGQKLPKDAKKIVEKMDVTVGKNERSLGKKNEVFGKSGKGVGKRGKSAGKSERSVGKRVGKSGKIVGKSGKIVGKSVENVGKITKRKWSEMEMELSGFRNFKFEEPSQVESQGSSKDADNLRLGGVKVIAEVKLQPHWTDSKTKTEASVSKEKEPSKSVDAPISGDVAKKAEGEAKSDSKSVTDKDTDKNKNEKTGEKEKEERKEKVPEPTFHLLDNPARVMRNQLKTMSIPASSRYESVKKVSIGGILILRDKSEGEPVEIVEPVKAGGTKHEEEPEVEPPEPFLFVDRD